MWNGGKGLEKAIHETHATIVGFHYYPNEWLKENYDYACRIANLTGYWYFPKFAMMPDTFRTQSNRNYIRLTWENHGVAPAYHKCKLYIRLVNKVSGQTFSRELAGSDNRTWMPDEIVAEQYVVDLDKNLAEGKYDLLINMRDECAFHKNRNIELGLKKERETIPGWYKFGEIMVN